MCTLVFLTKRELQQETLHVVTSCLVKNKYLAGTKFEEYLQRLKLLRCSSTVNENRTNKNSFLFNLISTR